MIPLPLPLQSEGPGIEVQLALGLGILAGLAVLVMGFKTYQTGRLIKNTPTAKVRSAAVGRTQLEGTAVPKDFVLERPFTDGNCLYAKITVEEYFEYDDDNKPNQWRTVFTKTLAPPFYVDDGTGQMLVDADAGTTFEIGKDNTYKKKVKKRQAPPEAVQDFLGATDGKAASTSKMGDIADVVNTVSSSGSDSGQAGQTVEQEAPEGESTAEGELDVEFVTRGEMNTHKSVLETSEGEGAEESDLEATDEDEGEESGFLGKIKGTASSVAEAAGNVSGNRAIGPTSRRRRRYTQEVLPVGADALVFGAAEPRDVEVSTANEDHLVVREDPSTDKFIVSDRGEDTIAWGYTKRALIFLVVGLLFSAGSLAALVYLGGL